MRPYGETNGDILLSPNAPRAEQNRTRSIHPPPRSDHRLLLVSNRLPVTIKRHEDGTYNFSISSGGLVTGLSGLSQSTPFQWYGWPGLEVPSAEIEELKQRLLSDYDAVPVYMDDKLVDEHYNGFSSTYTPRLSKRSKTDQRSRFYFVAASALPSR